MKSLKIGVVEEDSDIARTVVDTLEELGYIHSSPAVNYAGALEMLEREKPDLLLLGIPLTGEHDGMDVAQQVNEVYKIPFIFLAAQSNTETINRAKKVMPHAYIVLPFTQEELFATIEIAFSNFTRSHNETKSNEMALWNTPDFIFVKDGYAFHKIYVKDILFLESDGNYVTIHLQSKKKFLIRSTLRDFTDRFKQKMFIRVHRSYAINVSKIEDIFPTKLTIQGHKIPVGKSYKDEVYRVLRIRNN